MGGSCWRKTKLTRKEGCAFETLKDENVISGLSWKKRAFQ